MSLGLSGGTFSLRTGFMSPSRSISNQPMLMGFPHRAARFRSGGSPFPSPGCWRCRCMEGSLICGWHPILPGQGGTSTLSRRVPVATRWLCEPQPISNQPMWVGFPHRAGLYRLGMLFSWVLSCGRVSDPSWELFLSICRLLHEPHEPQPISDQPMG